MGKGEQTRSKIIAVAAQLMQRQGYAATGLKQVLAESNSPRGSFYFHFPGGKEDLAKAVVESHAYDFGQMLAAVLENTPSALSAAELSVDTLAAQFEATQCASGCPVTVIALEMANGSAVLREATRAAYEGWAQEISRRLLSEGHATDMAYPRARALLSAIEGALILSRSYGNRGPLDDLKSQLPRWLNPD